MNARLTLNLNSSLIEGAKLYAKENKMSLSELVESYLYSFTKTAPIGKRISPLVESLTGVIPDENINECKDYRSYLIEKYV